MADGGDGLVVVTRPVADLDDAAPDGPPSTVWSRGDDRMLGWGVAARISTRGPDRLRDAASAWRALAAAARVDDAVRVPGSGLVGFGAVAFADSSVADSVLVVPRTAVGVRGGTAWRTDVTGTARLDAAGTPVAGSDAAFDGGGYARAVDAAVRRIRAGELDKVVLARDAVLEPGAGWSAPEALAALAVRHRDAWAFLVDGFLGVSPETLVTTDGAAMTARVLAGTAPRADDPRADAAARDGLLASGKNRFEHALAVDSLLRALARVVPGLELGRPFALGLPNVWHLATDVSGRLVERQGALDLVAALHPTAAVAGAPTASALALIAELEPLDRRRYAGPVGWIDADGAGEWAIGLRSAELQADGLLRAWAGAGVVAGSEGETELAETGWKLAPMRELAAMQPTRTG